MEIEDLRDKLAGLDPQLPMPAPIPQKRQWPKFLLPISPVVLLVALIGIWYLNRPVSGSIHCYDQPEIISGTIPAHGVAYTPAFTTSTRCRDINAKFSVLMYPTAITAVRCDTLQPFTEEKQVFANEHYSQIASNVLNGTCFRLKLRNDQQDSYIYTGMMAY